MAAVMGLAMLSPVSVAPAAAQEASVLVFSHTAAFRHASIPTGVAAIEQLGDDHGFDVDATEDPADFNDDNLAGYDAVIWLSTTGSVLNGEQQAAFERYIQGGGGYVGIHAAADTHYDWAWYGGLVGAYFSSHPPGMQNGDVWVTDQAHPSTDMLPAVWNRTEEYYHFDINPRGDVHVLATVDEASYRDDYPNYNDWMGHDHPIAWCQNDYDGGRSWYTAGGHDHAHFSEDLFLEHMTGGILWAAGAIDGDCGGTIWDNYEKVVLDDDVLAPMTLEVDSQGRVFFLEKDGRLRIIDPVTGDTSTAAALNVFSGNEDGLVGITFHPDFDENGWLYLFYAPAGSEQVRNVSRFTMDGDTLDLDSEEILLQIPASRSVCCHTAGDIEFGPDGNLWISTGDDTDPFGSNNYTPIDERPGREGWDAQRTSANTNDLRGKLLRITPTDDGSYTIPEGNMFEPGTELTRPEIYAMGFRNPFRFSVDETSGIIYLADYGPDNRNDHPDRGPQGRVTWHIIDEPANYGWPYCHANHAYIDYDFETGESGDAFDCEGGPINDSPNNTGMTQTPPVKPATVWYGFSSQEPFPQLVGGAPMGGPRYEYDPDLDSSVKWPASFDGSVVFGEWGANQLFDFNVTDDREVTQISRMLPNMNFVNPQDFAFGPHDGALYMIEWGRSFGGPSPNSQIIRIEYHGVQDPDAPEVTATADQTAGDAPLPVAFSGAAVSPIDAEIVSYVWDFDDDGATADTADATHTYEFPGTYRPTLTVTDADGRTASATIILTVTGEEPPELPPGDLSCPAFLGDPVLTSDFDDATTQGWGSVAGEPVSASDAVARSGSHSLLVTGRSSDWMGPDRSLTNVIEEGTTYEIRGWLRAADGQGPGELWATGVSSLSGTTSYNHLGSVVEVTDDEWVEFVGEWTVPEFGTASVKFEGTVNLDFHLDDFSVVPYVADTDVPVSDEFNGTELDGCRWDRVVRYDEDAIEMTGGQLLIQTPEGDIYEDLDGEPDNFILQTQPNGDWTVETSYTEELVSSFSQAGLIVYFDDDNYVKFDTVADQGQTGVNRIELRSEVDGQIVGPQDNIDAPDNDGQWWLRLSKQGTQFTGEVSVDGENWIATPSPVENELVANYGAVGIFTMAVDDPSTTVAFDYFRLDGEEVPDDGLMAYASLDPSSPDGNNGWYVSTPVDLTLSSNDPAAALQWREAGDEEWITATETVSFTADGVYDLEYRAVTEGDEPGEPSEGPVIAVGPGFAFDPEFAQTDVGSTVSFVHEGGNHNAIIVDADGNEIDRSGESSSDWEADYGSDTYEFTPSAPGTYYYYCFPHTGNLNDPDPANWVGMIGVLEVEPSASAPGETSAIGEVSFSLDQTPPDTEAAVDEGTLTLTAVDETSGVDEVHWLAQGAEFHEVYEGPLTFDEAGDYVIGYRSVDVAGNVEEWSWIEFTVGDTPPTGDLELELTASARCVAGRVFVAVTARNDNPSAADVEIESDFGTRAFSGVVPDRFASHAFNTRSTAVDGGSVTVRGNALIDGQEASGEWTVDYDGLTC